MGQCSNKNSVGVIESINLLENDKNGSNLKKENSNTNELVNRTKSNLDLKSINFGDIRIVISYCWSDREASHALADKFIKEKFQVTLDRDACRKKSCL